jgi:hypothetical protein
MEWDEPELEPLTRAAVSHRYPGGSADRGNAAEAIRIGERLRPALLALISPS